MSEKIEKKPQTFPPGETHGLEYEGRPKTFLPFLFFIGVIVIITVVFLIFILSRIWNKNTNENLQNTKSLVSSINVNGIMGRWYVQSHLPTDLDENASNYIVSFSKMDEKSLQMQLNYDISLNKASLSENERIRSSVFTLRMDLPGTKRELDKISGQQYVTRECQKLSIGYGFSILEANH